ncbi:MAG TPA: hypothetical protein VHF28_06270 [Nitrososphaera sp.]|nr:hypothetical protein [Nitrososphaera sp.]
MPPVGTSPCALVVVPPVLPLVEFETIFSATGLSLNISGATIFPTLTVPMNIINTTMATNPALANFLAYEILSSSAKKDEIANKPTIGTADDTKTDLFGNSKGENDDIVSNIRMPEITVAFTITISLTLRLGDVPEEALDEALGEAPDNGGDI